MKLNDTLETKFSEQVTLEFESSLVYRQLAIVADLRDLPGIAGWLRHQADEEIVHANKIIDHMVARDNRPQIGDMPAPKVTGETVLELFEQALEHEQRVSASIRALYQSAEKEGDLDSRPLLDWFLAEQVDEEDTVSEIVGQLKLVGNDGSGLLRIDAELGERPTRSTEA